MTGTRGIIWRDMVPIWMSISANRTISFHLRSIYTLFDARVFAIVQEILEAESSFPSPQYVTHILSERKAEFWPTCHNILVQNLPMRFRPYLFARFAWAILLHVKHFVITRPRYIVKRNITVDEDGLDSLEYKTEVVPQKELMMSYGGGTKAAISKVSTPRRGQGA